MKRYNVEEAIERAEKDIKKLLDEVIKKRGKCKEAGKHLDPQDQPHTSMSNLSPYRHLVIGGYCHHCNNYYERNLTEEEWTEEKRWRDGLRDAVMSKIA